MASGQPKIITLVIAAPGLPTRTRDNVAAGGQPEPLLGPGESVAEGGARGAAQCEPPDLRAREGYQVNAGRR